MHTRYSIGRLSPSAAFSTLLLLSFSGLIIHVFVRLSSSFLMTTAWIGAASLVFLTMLYMKFGQRRNAYAFDGSRRQKLRSALK